MCASISKWTLPFHTVAQIVYTFGSLQYALHVWPIKALIVSDEVLNCKIFYATVASSSTSTNILLSTFWHNKTWLTENIITYTMSILSILFLATPIYILPLDGVSSFIPMQNCR